MPNILANFVPQVWSRRIIANINQINIAMAVMANTNYAGEISAAGDTVQVRTFGNITIQDYERGESITAEPLQPIKETLTVNLAKYFAFDVDSLDIAQNDINAIDGYTMRAGVAMANSIDTFLMGVALTGAQVTTANAIGSTGAPIAIDETSTTLTSYQQLVFAGRQLDKLSVPADGRYAIVSPAYKANLLQSTKYLIRSTDMGDAIIRSANIQVSDASRLGFFGQCAGFDCYMSPNMPNSGGSSPTWFANIFGQGKRVCYAAQIPPSTLEAIRLETTFATRVRGLLLHGGKVFGEDSKALGVIYTTT